MTVGIQETAGAGFLEIYLSGKLAKDDYTAFRPRFEEMLREHGKVRLLVRMHDFHGWTTGGVWEDLKFDAKHFNDIERIAFCGGQEMGSRNERPLQTIYDRQDPVFLRKPARGGA